MKDIPIVDMHTHFHPDLGPLGVYVDAMERNSVEAAACLSMPYPAIGTNKALAYVARALAPSKFIVFTAIDFRDAADEHFSAKACQRLEEDAHRGAQGLKTHIKSDAVIIHPNDDRLKPIYDKAAELSLPILAHLSVPVGRTDPAPEGPGLGFSSEEQYQALRQILADHPATNFILAHLGCCRNGPSLDRLSQLMCQHENLYADTSATFLFFAMMREPEPFREFLLRHEDRIVFGTDTDLSATIEAETLARFYGDAYGMSRDLLGGSGPTPLTAEQRLRRREWVHDTGEWESLERHDGDMPGLDLPKETLEKILNANAKRILGPARPVDKEWMLRQAQALRTELAKAMEHAPAEPFEYARYLMIKGRRSYEYFRDVAEQHGVEALRTAVSDRWDFSKAHTERAIGILDKAMEQLSST